MKLFSKAMVVCAAAILGGAAQAATVNCSFMSETQITKDGQWLRSEMDFMKLFEVFGDGIELPLENSLLANLDSQVPFYVGDVQRGGVYLMGGDMGIEGKLIRVDAEIITIYDGLCDISFG
jgi:hypothetical protein